MALGLSQYRQRKAEEAARREAASGPKVQRFALKKDGDSAVVRFAQELDYDAKNYDEGRGIGFVNIEHTNGSDPKNGWKNRANCSMESQGACLPCEKVQDHSQEWEARKGWKQKDKFYINVIGGEPVEEKYSKPNGDEGTRYFTSDIDRTTGDGSVYLLEQGTYNGIYDALADYFLEDEVSGGTITDKYFKISRKGSGFNDTSYGITPLKEIPEDAKGLDEFELYNLKKDVLVEIPYAQQDAFYYRGVEVSRPTAGDNSEADADVDSTTTTDDTW